MLEVGHAKVTDLVAGPGFVAIDRVAVEIERDVVGSDHDAVARAVHEVAVERRVGGDGVAAAHVARGRLTCGEREADSGGCEDHREFTDSHCYRHRPHVVQPAGIVRPEPRSPCCFSARTPSMTSALTGSVESAS